LDTHGSSVRPAPRGAGAQLPSVEPGTSHIGLVRARSGRVPSALHSGEWRNWQTRRLQVPVSERMWVFKSPLAHVTQVFRIEDLREPRRDEREQAIYDFAISLDVDLAPRAIVEDAIATAGTDEFGDPTLLDRLRAQVDAVDADTGLTGLG